MKNIKFALLLIIYFMSKQILFSQTKLNINMNNKKPISLFIPTCSSTNITQQTFKKDLNKFSKKLEKFYSMQFINDSLRIENRNFIELYRLNSIKTSFFMVSINSSEINFSLIQGDSIKTACIKNIPNIKYKIKGYQNYNGRIEFLTYYTFDNSEYFYFTLVFNKNSNAVLLDFDEVGIIEKQ